MKMLVVILLSLAVISCQQEETFQEKGELDDTNQLDQPDHQIDTNEETKTRDTEWSHDSSDEKQETERERRDTAETEDSGTEDTASATDDGLPRSTDRADTGNPEQTDDETDSVPEEESDTPLDTTPNDTGDCGPCCPGEEIPELCCNCEEEEWKSFCIEYCEELLDTEEDPDTGTGAVHECPELYVTKCDSTGTKILECQAFWDPEIYDHHWRWAEIHTCQDYQECFPDKKDEDRATCYRVVPPEGIRCDFNVDYEICVEGYSNWWIMRCYTDEFLLLETCEHRCISMEGMVPPAFTCSNLD